MEELTKRGYESFLRIDEGGQAKVYKSRRKDRTVAIKVVRVEDPNNPKLDEDLKRELQIVRNLRHPNCIKVEELFRTKSKIYIIMEYMPNGTVGGYIRENGEICEWNARLWFCPTAKAVKYLHDRKIAHRDLKLDNILLDMYFNPVVSDFGFSRFVSMNNGSIVKSDTYCGTTSYNPPEVLKQIPYNPFAADIWCLGVMLFIMINRIYPFDRRDRAKMYECQMKRIYKLQDYIDAKSTTFVKDLIRKLLEPEPEKRLSIKEVCEHPWFPNILRDSQMPSSKSSQTSVTINSILKLSSSNDSKVEAAFCKNNISKSKI